MAKYTDVVDRSKVGDFRFLANACVEQFFSDQKFVKQSHKFEYEAIGRSALYTAIYSQDARGVIGRKDTCGFPVRSEWDIEHFRKTTGKSRVVMGLRTIKNMSAAKIRIDAPIIPYCGVETDYGYVADADHRQFSSDTVYFGGGARVLVDMYQCFDKIIITVFDLDMQASDPRENYVVTDTLERVICRAYDPSPGSFISSGIEFRDGGFIATFKRFGKPVFSGESE